MVIPIGDAPNPRGVPVATYLLIAANVAVYALVTLPLGFARPAPGDPMLAEYVRVVSEGAGARVRIDEILRQITAYDLFLFRHGFRPGSPSLAALLTSMFLHGGLLHLVGNMLFLWIYGDNVEHRLGRARYVLWYLGTGLAATLFHAAGARDSLIPMVGASGAISGVLGFYFVWFPRNQVRLLWLLPPFVMDVFTVPARLVLGLYLIADNLLPYLIASGQGGVAHGAHIGGFLAGLAAAWVMDRRRLRVPAGYEPGAPEDALALAERLRAEGDTAAALAVLGRRMRARGSAAGLGEAHLLAAEILLENLGQPVAAYQHLRWAMQVDPTLGHSARVRAGLAAIEALQKRRIGRPHVRRLL